MNEVPTTTLNCSQIPLELQLLIIACVKDNRDLASAAVVCKAWRPVAEKELYHSPFGVVHHSYFDRPASSKSSLYSIESKKMYSFLRTLYSEPPPFPKSGHVHSLEVRFFRGGTEQHFDQGLDVIEAWRCIFQRLRNLRYLLLQTNLEFGVRGFVLPKLESVVLLQSYHESELSSFLAAHSGTLESIYINIPGFRVLQDDRKFPFPRLRRLTVGDPRLALSFQTTTLQSLYLQRSGASLSVLQRIAGPSTGLNTLCMRVPVLEQFLEMATRAADAIPHLFSLSLYYDERRDPGYWVENDAPWVESTAEFRNVLKRLSKLQDLRLQVSYWNSENSLQNNYLTFSSAVGPPSSESRDTLFHRISMKARAVCQIFGSEAGCPSLQKLMLGPLVRIWQRSRSEPDHWEVAEVLNYYSLRKRDMFEMFSPTLRDVLSS